MPTEFGYFIATDVFIGYRIPSEPPVVGEPVAMDRMQVEVRWKGRHDNILLGLADGESVASWSESYQSPRGLVFANCGADGKCRKVTWACTEYSHGLGKTSLIAAMVASWPHVVVGWATETFVGLAVVAIVVAWLMVLWRRRQQRTIPKGLRVLALSPILLVPVGYLLLPWFTRCPAHWGENMGGTAPPCAVCEHRVALKLPRAP
jgi:hypothetical protein